MDLLHAQTVGVRIELEDELLQIEESPLVGDMLPDLSGQACGERQVTNLQAKAYQTQSL